METLMKHRTRLLFAVFRPQDDCGLSLEMPATFVRPSRHSRTSVARVFASPHHSPTRFLRRGLEAPRDRGPGEDAPPDDPPHTVPPPLFPQKKHPKPHSPPPPAPSPPPPVPPG